MTLREFHGEISQIKIIAKIILTWTSRVSPCSMQRERNPRPEIFLLLYLLSKGRNETLFLQRSRVCPQRDVAGPKTVKHDTLEQCCETTTEQQNSVQNSREIGRGEKRAEKKKKTLSFYPETRHRSWTRARHRTTRRSGGYWALRARDSLFTRTSESERCRERHRPNTDESRVRAGKRKTEG